jgi:flagellar hook assembly protein FlgD
MISFSLPQRGPVSLAIYNNKGQMIKSLIDGSTLESGAHTFTWDGRDKYGKPVSSGIYLYRLQSGANRQTRKMVLSK